MRFHTTTSMATNVTLNTSNALLYADTTFAATNFTLANGNNTFTAIARDGLGRVNTNSLTVNLPATNSYAYDLNGNLLTNGTEVLVYNDENELVTNFVAGLWKSEFVYDGKLRRRIERDYSWAGSAWTQTNEIRFVYDGNVVIQHRAANNAPLLALTRGIDLSGTLFGAGGIGGLLAMTEGSGVSSFYHADGNGNITALVNASQILVGQAKYDSFGNFISLSGAKVGINGYWFSSKPIHWQSGKYDFLYRWYVPNLQRWPNRDPLGDYAFFRQIAFGKTWAEKQGLRAAAVENLFMFTHNKPINQVDLLGLFSGWGSAGGYGVPGSDVMNQMNTKPSCIGEILDTYRMFLGNSGFDSYPTANDDDKLQHCITSCRLARACGRAVAASLGHVKELRDAFGEGSDRNDDDANRHGRNGVNCPKKSCEDYCNETRSQYGDLPLLTPSPPPTWSPGLGGL